MWPGLRPWGCAAASAPGWHARSGTRRTQPDAVPGSPGRGTVAGPPPLANANEPLTPGNEGRCVMPQVIPPAVPSDDPSLLTFPAAELLAGTLPFERLSPTLRLRLTELTYIPKVAGPRSDWVATVAMPALLTYRARYPDTVGGGTVGIVGTGAGLDALAAIEVLAPTRVVVTDVHQEVVTQAVHNIQANLRAPHTVQVD